MWQTRPSILLRNADIVLRVVVIALREIINQDEYFVDSMALNSLRSVGRLIESSTQRALRPSR